MRENIKRISNDFSKKNSNNNSSFKRNNNGPKRSFNSRPKRNFGGEKIEISRFIKKPSLEREVVKVEIKHTFDDFEFCPQLNNNLKKRNYTQPTPIQDQSIKPIMAGRDIIGLANTGTGKTAAFLLPLINKVSNDRSQKVLIIVPTRELAQQIESEIHQFSYDMGIFYATCVGGMPINHQIRNLKRNPSFVIGTPGRLNDLSDRKMLNFARFNNIVLDEVDRMLDMGFVEEIKKFLAQLPTERQSLFFSATMPPKIRDLVTRFTNDPITVEVSSGKTAENVEQDVVRITHKGMKFDLLKELLADPELAKVLIFSETKRDVEKLAINLTKEGFKAESIHGDKRQSQRVRALSLFKKDHVNILVATDVAARGIDVKDVTHVINYTVPKNYDDYIHRIGRTGRGDKLGKALTFVETV